MFTNISRPCVGHQSNSSRNSSVPPSLALDCGRKSRIILSQCCSKQASSSGSPIGSPEHGSAFECFRAFHIGNAARVSGETSSVVGSGQSLAVNMNGNLNRNRYCPLTAWIRYYHSPGVKKIEKIEKISASATIIIAPHIVVRGTSIMG